MPQPLSGLKKKTQLFIGNNTDSPSRHRPKLALAAMNVIAEWSILESFVLGLFVQMLGKNPRPAVAMYSALTSEAAKRDTLRAVADVALNYSQEKRDVFDAILDTIKTASKDRIKIAHWIWGHSKDLPDAVLLLDPSQKAKQDVASAEYSKTISEFYKNLLANKLSEKELPRHPGLSNKGIYIYKQKDFDEASKKIQRAIHVTVMFRFVLIPGHPVNEGDKLFSRLKKEPEIRTFLARLKQRRKNNQKAEK